MLRGQFLCCLLSLALCILALTIYNVIAIDHIAPVQSEEIDRITQRDEYINLAISQGIPKDVAEEIVMKYLNTKAAIAEQLNGYITNFNIDMNSSEDTSNTEDRQVITE